MTYSTEDVVNYTHRSSPTWHVSRNNDLTNKMGFVLSKTTGMTAHPCYLVPNTIQYNTILEYPYVYERRYHHHLLPYTSLYMVEFPMKNNCHPWRVEENAAKRWTMSMKTPNWTTQVLCQLVYELRCMYWASCINEEWNMTI